MEKNVLTGFREEVPAGGRWRPQTVRSAVSRPPPLPGTPARAFHVARSVALVLAARAPRRTGPSRDRARRPGGRGAEAGRAEAGGGQRRPFSLRSRGHFSRPDFTCKLKCHLAATLGSGVGSRS